MAQFAANGQLNRDEFLRVVGSVMREATSRGGPVRAYGEMVDLLWGAGDVLGAIELERLWNELRGELPFSLLCGYSSSVLGSEQGEPVVQICQLHSRVLRPRSEGPDPRVDAAADE